MGEEANVRKVGTYEFNKRYMAQATQAVHGAIFGKIIFSMPMRGTKNR